MSKLKYFREGFWAYKQDKSDVLPWPQERAKAWKGKKKSQSSNQRQAVSEGRRVTCNSLLTN